MDGAFNKHGEDEEGLLQLEGKPEKKTSLARHTGRCDDVIKPTSECTEGTEVALWQWALLDITIPWRVPL